MPSRVAGAWLASLVVLAGICQSGQATQTAGRSISLNGIEMYYEEVGAGDPLVLLYYFHGSGVVWDPFIDDFAEEFRVIVPDLRGHGRSTNPVGKFTHRQSAADVFALLEHLQIKKFKAMGMSTGGMTLIHMATQQPERVEAMVLIGATSYFPEQTREILRGWFDSKTEQDWERMRRRHKHGDQQIESLWRQFEAFQHSYDDMNFTPPYLSTIAAETLIVHGERDQFFPVSIPVTMYEAIPRAYL